MKDGGWRTEDGGWRMEDRGWRKSQGTHSRGTDMILCSLRLWRWGRMFFTLPLSYLANFKILKLPGVFHTWLATKVVRRNDTTWAVIDGLEDQAVRG